MKKLLVMATALFSLGYIAVAEVSKNETSKTGIVSVNQTDKVKITYEELPQAVKDELTNNYKDWQAGDVYKVSGTNEYYSIELKKDAETKTVNLDKDGKEAKIEA
ncbi:MAG: hypothetical protein HC830_07090 [Bacteroidetes bacterium]|nr:hypothetical protein [Bacteroidota bacterium]